MPNLSGERANTGMDSRGRLTEGETDAAKTLTPAGLRAQLLRLRFVRGQSIHQR